MTFIPYLLDITIYIKANIKDIFFTGKLIKSLLIDANPKLKSLFKKSRGALPKLIHISPLYETNNGKFQCVYSYAIMDTKGNKIKGIRSVTIKDGIYKFYVGFVESNVINTAVDFETIYNTLLNMRGKHKFKKYVINVELLSIDIIDVYNNTEYLVKKFLKNMKLKIIFSSPTLLRDPLRTSKQKSLIPTPINLFSTPLYINLFLEGKLRRRIFMKTLLMLHRIINEPYSIYRTVKIKWILYDREKQPIPTLTGYVNFYLNKDYYEYYSLKYDIEKNLRNIFLTLSALGTGTSRATGFGHILVKNTTK